MCTGVQLSFKRCFKLGCCVLVDAYSDKQLFLAFRRLWWSTFALAGNCSKVIDSNYDVARFSFVYQVDFSPNSSFGSTHLYEMVTLIAHVTDLSFRWIFV